MKQDMMNVHYIWNGEQYVGWCLHEDVTALEKEHASACKHMNSMYYALCDILVPDPEDDPEDVMLRARRVIERFQNDELQTVMVEWPDDDEDDNADDVEMLEAYNERLRSMLQRIVHEAVKKRVDWRPTYGWLATSHHGDMYAINYEINAELMNAIKAVLNNEEEQDND